MIVLRASESFRPESITVVLFVVWAFPRVDLDRGVARAMPREVAPRGVLGSGERAIIDLFEQARGSVVYITRQSQVLDLWTRNASTSREAADPGSCGTTRGIS